MNFEEIIDEPRLLRALKEQGYETATPIQQQAIPVVLEGMDLRGSAQTGTGKTAAFLLPALRLLAKGGSARGPRILILVPTRELAMQVSAEAVKLAKYLPVKTVCVFGGVPYPMQTRQLQKPYDILIATPGRLIDFLERKRIRLDCVEMLILDEADRMLDMGFIEPVEYIAAATPSERQTLMFSATFGKKVGKLAETLLRDPADVQIAAERQNHEQIEQKIQHTENLEHKHKLLEEALPKDSLDQAIVFSSTKMQADELADLLREWGYDAEALHGDMNQRQRTRTIQMLRQGRIRILVATDVAARGIDIPNLSLVINFDLPRTLDEYIHRIGRTGRAGGKGTALSFASKRDRFLSREIEKFAGLKPTFEEKKMGKKPFGKKPFKKFDRPWKKNFRSAPKGYKKSGQ